jgi:hypothetical protein
MKRKNNHYISNLESVSKKNKTIIYNEMSNQISNKRKYNSDVFNYIYKKFKRFKFNYSMDEEFENIFSDFTNCNINEELMEYNQEDAKYNNDQSTNPYFIDIY